MLFNSYEFIFLFLPAVLLIFYAFCQFGMVRAAVWWTGIASLLFYAYWDWHFLFLFAASIIFNYVMGSAIVLSKQESTRKYLLITGLITNLGLLAFFKYSHFFLQNIIDVTGVSLTIPNIILPVGISFFTFTQIAYLVDCMREQHKYQFADYLVFVSFFPHLVAGPILRHDKTIPQIESKRFGKPSARKVYIAIVFFSIGLFKKVVIADSLAGYVDNLFAHADTLSVLEAWTAALLYTFQIFFDFSAYSEMAIGLAFLMNVRIPFNFNSPYKAISIIDFWRRWHISLSSFLRDYLYIPLGGNRKGPKRRYLNLFITMLLGGLWHGAAWTFVIWGGLHGMYLAINHAWQRTGIKLPAFVAWSITFLAVVIAWIFFRAQHLTTAFSLLKTMFKLNGAALLGTQLPHPLLMLISIAALIGVARIAPNVQQIAIARQPAMRMAILTAVLLVIGILNLGHNANFIYFQF